MNCPLVYELILGVVLGCIGGVVLTLGIFAMVMWALPVVVEQQALERGG